VRQKGLDFGSAGPAPAPGPRPRRALRVSELTDRIQGLLETEFVDVWVEGEVSNLKFHASGHWYFSLKDAQAQIRAVVWKTDARLIRFRPADGMQVLARGQVRVYAPRGEYQLQVLVLEPVGKGSLQAAFEQLKERLGREGLFAAERKRPLPLLPRRIGVVTSPTGAVIRDILRVLRARFPSMDVLLYPARVQGAEAAAEIVQGIRALNRVGEVDVIVVARGGGSLEDLWAFNEEAVARALAASRVPTISAVGHETDVTIADFVADVRAATPSAAAERVVRPRAELLGDVAALRQRAGTALQLQLTRVRARLAAATAHRVFEAERGRLTAQATRVARLRERSAQALRLRLERAGRDRRAADGRLAAFPWGRVLGGLAQRAEGQRGRLSQALQRGLREARGRLEVLDGRLVAMSPVEVLARGYALVWESERQRLLRDAKEARVGDELRIQLARGALRARVTGTEEA
jgi:exodeoxyribonuclease VII large subunit